MEFQEYPKRVYKGDESTIVNTIAEENKFLGVETDDKENKERVSSEVGKGGEPQQAEPIKETSEEASCGSGIFFKTEKENGTLRILALNTPFGEITGDSATRYAECIRNIFNADSFLEKGYSGIDIPSRLDVLSNVIGLIEDDKIFKSIIPFIPIDMMNHFITQKGAPIELFHNNSMFVSALRASADSDIIAPIVEFIVRSPAIFTAKCSLGITSTRRTEQLNSAINTNDKGISEIPSMTHKSIIQKTASNVNSIQAHEGQESPVGILTTCEDLQKVTGLTKDEIVLANKMAENVPVIIRRKPGRPKKREMDEQGFVPK